MTVFWEILSIPYNVAMFGWFKLASSLASRSKRDRRSALPATSSGRTLSATSRPSLASSARHTSPMPPFPNEAVIR